MCRKATVCRAAVVLCAAAVLALAQDAPRVSWRHIGNSAIELALPSAATGPVDRVWYSPNGAVLFAKTHSGHIFQTSDFETWTVVTDSSIAPPLYTDPAPPSGPEPGARIRMSGARLYSYARNAFRSDDNGATWINLTDYRGASILGSPLSDFAASPTNPDEITASNAAGVWRSVDAGLSWTGLNSGLPNLPVRRLFQLPTGLTGVEIGLSLNGAPELEWAPGEKTAWRVTNSSEQEQENQLKTAAAQALHVEVTAVAWSGDAVYAGSANGTLWTSLDRGATWSAGWATVATGPVTSIWVDAKDPRIAFAAFGAHAAPLPSGVSPTHVMRTMNGGLFWDSVTANLPDTAAHGVTADRASNSVYLATDNGVFYTTVDMAAAGRATPWSRVSDGLPSAPAMDVKVDPGGNQLYVALDGYGVYAAIAPHRFRDARVVNAADFSGRAAAPGSLLSVLGLRVTAAHSGDTMIPVLAADATGTQIQVPFNVTGQNLALALDSPRGSIIAGFPLRNVSPAIFVDPDGTPMLLDGDSGMALDASNPARSGSRIQILATGLGRVDPEWPSGTPGPVADAPRVVAPLRAYLDRTPIEVSRAVLAPYVGFYLVEVQLPRIVNAGPAELYIETEGQTSNRVRLYIEP